MPPLNCKAIERKRIIKTQPQLSHTHSFEQCEKSAAKPELFKRECCWNFETHLGIICRVGKQWSREKKTRETARYMTWFLIFFLNVCSFIRSAWPNILRKCWSLYFHSLCICVVSLFFLNFCFFFGYFTRWPARLMHFRIFNFPFICVFILFSSSFISWWHSAAHFSRGKNGILVWEDFLTFVIFCSLHCLFTFSCCKRWSFRFCSINMNWGVFNTKTNVFSWFYMYCCYCNHRCQSANHCRYYCWLLVVHSVFGYLLQMAQCS